MLSYISSHLASRPAAALAPGDTRSSGGGGAPALRTDMRLWEVQWEDVTPLRAIGRGSFGRVYPALWNETQVACKVLISEDAALAQEPLQLPDDTMHKLQKEAAVMARMRHPSIIGFLGLCALPPCIITGGRSSACSEAAEAHCCVQLT